MPELLDKQTELYAFVKAFIEEFEISCPEAVQQSDRVQEVLADFVADICAIVGFYTDDAEN